MSDRETTNRKCRIAFAKQVTVYETTEIELPAYGKSIDEEGVTHTRLREQANLAGSTSTPADFPSMRHYIFDTIRMSNNGQVTLRSQRLLGLPEGRENDFLGRAPGRSSDYRAWNQAWYEAQRLMTELASVDGYVVDLGPTVDAEVAT